MAGGSTSDAHNVAAAKVLHSCQQQWQRILAGPLGTCHMAKSQATPGAWDNSLAIRPAAGHAVASHGQEVVPVDAFGLASS
jgi:hypothetical protein